MPDTIARADLRLLHAAHEFGDLPAGVRFPVADAGMLRRLADFHGRARRSPGHPAVAASYRAFVAETEAQFLALARRIEIEPWPLSRGPQPYRCSGEVLEDLRAGHVFFYTEAALPDAHPLAAPSSVRIGGFRLVWNHVFRAVHDAYGHSIYRTGFGPTGEWQAFATHARLYSAAALPALVCEAVMQAAAFNYGPDAHLPAPLRRYPPQHAYLPPAEACQAPPLVDM